MKSAQCALVDPSCIPLVGFRVPPWLFLDMPKPFSMGNPSPSCFLFKGWNDSEREMKYPSHENMVCNYIRVPPAVNWNTTYSFFIVVQLQLSQFSSPLALPCPVSHPCVPTVNPYPIVPVVGSFIYVLCLFPSPALPHYPSSPSTLVIFSLFHLSILVILFCSLVFVVH